MIEVPLDDPRIAESGLEVLEGDAAATFTIPPDREGDPPRLVKVAIVGTDLHFFPQRSSGQKRLLAVLGLAVE